jgi:hypothetical protein
MPCGCVFRNIMVSALYLEDAPGSSYVELFAYRHGNWLHDAGSRGRMEVPISKSQGALHWVDFDVGGPADYVEVSNCDHYAPIKLLIRCEPVITSVPMVSGDSYTHDPVDDRLSQLEDSSKRFADIAKAFEMVQSAIQVLDKRISSLEGKRGTKMPNGARRVREGE